MEKVALSRAARIALGERLGQPIPNPESEAFDALLEELREMQPDLYTDLVGALEYRGEALPVEKEALRAQKRAHRQKLADHLKNRRTHDGKRVPDKRKSLLLGGALATVVMGWISYTNISNGFTARAAATAEDTAAQPTTQPITSRLESPFGVESGSPDLDMEFDLPETVRVVQAAPPPPPPPAQEAPEPTTEPEPQPARTISPLPFRTVQTVEPPQDEPEDELPPVPGPPQPGVASAPPISPYLASGPGVTPMPTGEPVPLPANLSFAPLTDSAEEPSTILSPEGQDDTGLPSAPGTTLTVTPRDSASEQALPPASLSPERAQEEAPAATRLNWEGGEEEATTSVKSLSFAQGEQTTPSTTSAQSTLPPVPQVGGDTPAPPAPQATTQPPAVEPEVTDLSALLSPGTPLEAELVTGVAAADGAAVPVIARTTGNWCGGNACPEITWIGEASYAGTSRVELVFSQAVVGNTVQRTTATAFDRDRLPGVQASVRDAAPTAIQDVIRGAVGGASSYLDALNSRETVFLREGEIITEQAEPDLGNYLLQRGTELFSLPTEQTSILRLAEIAPGTPFTVIYGL